MPRTEPHSLDSTGKALQLPPSEEYEKLIREHPSLLAIGGTPLVRLDMPLDVGNSVVSAKYEHLNPGGSIKDRPVLRMLLEAIIARDLTPGRTILDATSGNAGIAYAMIGAALGYEVELVMPENASEERKKRLRAHKAKIIFTDAMLGYDESLHEVRRRYEADPDKYFWCDQYSNQNNPLAHYETTAEEIISQAPDLTHFVAGVGTGGTISGVGRRLKEHNPNIEVVGINPPLWPGVEGLKHLGEGHIVPKTFHRQYVDRMIDIDVDASYQMSRKMSERGLFAGQSSGAYAWAAYRVAGETRAGHVVTIFNDIGERYFSTGMWDRNS